MSALHPYGTVGFLDEGKTKQTLDGLTLDVWDRPPFRRKGGDPFRSSLLRRFFFILGNNNPYAQWVWVDDRGRLMVGLDTIGKLRDLLEGTPDPPTNESREAVAAAMDYIKREHRLHLTPYAYEGVIFWREHGSGSTNTSWAYVNSAQDLSHLL